MGFWLKTCVNKHRQRSRSSTPLHTQTTVPKNLRLGEETHAVQLKLAHLCPETVQGQIWQESHPYCHYSVLCTIHKSTCHIHITSFRGGPFSQKPMTAKPCDLHIPKHNLDFWFFQQFLCFQEQVYLWGPRVTCSHLHMLVRLQDEKHNIFWRQSVPPQHFPKWQTFVQKQAQGGPEYVFTKNPRWLPSHMTDICQNTLKWIIWWSEKNTCTLKFWFDSGNSYASETKLCVPWKSCHGWGEAMYNLFCSEFDADHVPRPPPPHFLRYRWTTVDAGKPILAQAADNHLQGASGIAHKQTIYQSSIL